MAKSDYLKYIRTRDVKTGRLHFQYVPAVFNQYFWHGDGTLLIKNSPHIRFLQTFDKVGMNWDELWKTDYVNLMLYWNSIGYHNRTDEFIRSKIKRFTTLFRSMKNNGYRPQSRIEILKTPFWESRYGVKTDFVRGYEIWHGHHRAACCYFLGIKIMTCNLMADAKSGSKKCRRLDKKLAKVKK